MTETFIDYKEAGGTVKIHGSKLSKTTSFGRLLSRIANKTHWLLILHCVAVYTDNTEGAMNR